MNQKILLSKKEYKKELELKETEDAIKLVEASLEDLKRGRVYNF